MKFRNVAISTGFQGEKAYLQNKLFISMSPFLKLAEGGLVNYCRTRCGKNSKKYMYNTGEPVMSNPNVSARNLIYFFASLLLEKKQLAVNTFLKYVYAILTPTI
jgi:hypothetical protein